MRPALVADVGNSRIKWGRCVEGRVADSVSLPPDDPQAWQRQMTLWSIGTGAFWIVAGVHPQRRDDLAEWIRQRGDQVQILHSCRQLPLRVLVEKPDCAGIDRLLNAVAASRRVPHGVGAVIVDAGSAITVDWLDESAAFAGGSIFPGIRLMAQALHDYTALLPVVQVTHSAPPLPGTSTAAAIEAGVLWAAAGGIQALLTRLGARASSAPLVFLTGGDGPLLAEALDQILECERIQLWPNMTLEGIRIAAETTS
jgi:type III pantothenate kinase